MLTEPVQAAAVVCSERRMPYELFERVLEALNDGFRQIEAKVPPPVQKPWLGSFVFRYEEQTIQQAIVQKLARLLSGLHAIEALLGSGLIDHIQKMTAAAMQMADMKV
jgi:hypothetical protein